MRAKPWGLVRPDHGSCTIRCAPKKDWHVKVPKGILSKNELEKAAKKQCSKGAHELNAYIALNSCADGALILYTMTIKVQFVFLMKATYFFRRQKTS